MSTYTKPKFRIHSMSPHPTSGSRVHLQCINQEAQDLWEQKDFGLVRYANEIKRNKLNNK